MQDVAVSNLIEGKSEEDRIRFAQRVGDRFSATDLPEAEFIAAEALAQALVQDEIERVRRALSLAVKASRFLPRDIALKIAHDVDSVACPFLESTEVFSDEEWQRLLLTISRGARIAVARRTSMSEGLALALSETGDTEVAEVLVENENAPLNSLICHVLIDRFENATWILDKLSERDGLGGEIVISLVAKVSNAARRKLSKEYDIPDYTNLIGIDAETAALLQVIGETPEAELCLTVQSLAEKNLLVVPFLLRAVSDGHLSFFEAAMSHLSDHRLEVVRRVIRHDGTGPVTKLLKRANIPTALHDEFWMKIDECRRRRRQNSDEAVQDVARDKSVPPRFSSRVPEVPARAGKTPNFG